MRFRQYAKNVSVGSLEIFYGDTKGFLRFRLYQPEE